MKEKNVKRLFVNLLSLGSGEIVASLFYLAITVYLARTLGVTAFGKYDFSLAFYMYFSIIALCGIDTIGTRELSRLRSDPAQMAGLTNKIISLIAATSLISFLSLCLITAILPLAGDIKALILLNGIIILFRFLYIEWFFIGIEKMNYIGIGKILSAAVLLAATVLFIKGPGDLLTAAALRTIALILGIIFLVVIYHRHWGALRFAYDAALWKKILADSLPVFLTAILFQLHYRFDIFMLGFMKGVGQVGLYSAAFKIVFFLTILRSVAGKTILPALSRYFVESREKLQELVTLSQKAAILFAVPLGFGATILAPKLIPLLYGKAYLPAVVPFQILIWSFTLIGINFSFPQLQIACNRSRDYLFFSVFCTLFNITLNVLLIPRYGIQGAAAATVAADLIGLILYYRASRQFVRIDLPGLMASPLGASLGMSTVLYLLRTANLFLSIGLSSLTYVSLLLLTRYIKKSDLIHLRNSLLSK